MDFMKVIDGISKIKDEPFSETWWPQVASYVEQCDEAFYMNGLLNYFNVIAGSEEGRKKFSENPLHYMLNNPFNEAETAMIEDWIEILKMIRESTSVHKNQKIAPLFDKLIKELTELYEMDIKKGLH